MNISNAFTKGIFALLSLLLFTSYSINTALTQSAELNAILGIGMGAAFCLILFGSDYLFRGVSLKAINTLTLGMIFGYVLGQTMILTLTGLLDLAAVPTSTGAVALIKSGLLLFSIYFGVLTTFRAAEEIYVSLPFFKLKPSTQKKRDYLLDSSILTDSRMIDLATSGLLDNHIIIPRFVMKEIYEMSEGQNEAFRAKARRALEVVKKMETIPALEIRFNETDFPDIKDIHGKLVRLARLIDANLLTADMSQIEQSSVEGVRIINIHTIAKALKPLSHTGEYLQIKVQRYGKEARQGVGYLDDGTMVVINGGAEFIGETIKVQVLSVKHTSSGRMIFCNAANESMPPMDEDDEDSYGNVEQTAKNYFAL